MKINYQNIKYWIEREGYRFFDQGSYNLNLFGIRNPSLEVNLFNDWMGVAYRDAWGNEQLQVYAASTKPGLHYLKRGMLHGAGTAIVIPGQYRGVWKLGRHKGYEALQQQWDKSFAVWRDGDQDGAFDYEGKVYYDARGINAHTTSFYRSVDRVEAYSAGCQVLQDHRDFIQLIQIVKKALDAWPNSFSYTLLEGQAYAEASASEGV